MSEGHRLCVLQVRESWRHRGDVLRCLGVQRFDQIHGRLSDGACRIAEIQAEIGRYLIVPASSGAQRATQVSELVHQQTLNGGVHVFIRSNWRRGAVDHLGAQFVDCTHDSGQVVITDETSACEHVRMDSCLREVV